MRKTARNCILIILAFLTTLFLAVGFSTWIILNEKSLPITLFDAIETEIDTTAVPELSKIYAGNESTLVSSITDNVKVKAGETNLTDKGIFDIEIDWDNIYTATGTATGVTADVEVSFKVKEQYKYVYAEPDSKTISIPLEPAAYCGSVYYSTVDYAITNTTSGKITVIPTRDYAMEMNDSTADSPTAKIAKTISNATEIKNNVTLSLPYTASKVTDYFNTSNNYGSNYVLGMAKDTSASYTNSDEKTVNYYPAKERSTSARRNDPTKYLKNNITIASGHTLVNNGSIEIGGVISGGNGGQALNCYTIVDYAQITLQSSAKLQSNGTITNYGFIASDGTYTGTQKPQLLLENGKLTAPFSLVEHRGGTIFAGVYFQGGGTSGGATSNPIGLPFNRFYMENVVVETKITSNAQIISYVNLWATTILGGDNNESTFTLIGSASSDAFIKLQSGSYIISNFSSAELKNYLDFYGDFTVDSMNLSVLDRKISSSNSHFPISNHYSITLNKIPESNKNAEVSFKQKIKIMQGGSLTVNKGVDLTANEITVYTTNCFDKTKAAAAGYKYQTELADGLFVVNGSLTTSNNVGGLIQTTIDHANIQLLGSNSVTSYELASGEVNSKLYPTSGSATFESVSKTLSLNLTDGSTTSTAGTYYSKNGKWYSVDFNVVFDAQGGTGGQTINVKDEIDNNLGTNGGYIVTLPTATPTRTHYTFSHWCTNKNCTNDNTCSNKFANKTVVFEETTIYAIWTANTYTIKYNITFDTGITPITQDNETFSATNPLTPTKPTIDGKNFFGWYSDSAMTKLITTDISTALLDNRTLTADSNREITIYGKFVNNYKVTFYVNNSEIASEFGSDTYHHDDNAKPNEVYPTGEYNNILATAKQYDETETVTVYFAGWNTKADGSGTAWTPDMPITENIQLYAQWTKKHVLSFNTTTENGNVQVTAPTQVYLITGQEYDLSKYNETLTANDELMDKTKYFGGWYNGETLVTSISINGNTTLTAKWLDKYVITVKDVIENNAKTTKTYYAILNQAFELSTDLVTATENYSASTDTTQYFLGWNGATDKDTTITIDKVTESVTYTANWDDKRVITVVGLVDDNSNTVTKVYNIIPKQTFELSTDLVTAINNYSASTDTEQYFLGWNDATDKDATITITSVTENKTYTANWQTKYVVKVVGLVENGANNATKEYNIIPGEPFELSSDLVTAITDYSDSEKKEHYFLGWKVNGETVRTDVELEITSVTEDKTYTANWGNKSKVSYIKEYTGLNGLTDISKLENYQEDIWIKPGTEITAVSASVANLEKPFSRTYTLSSFTLLINGTKVSDLTSNEKITPFEQTTDGTVPESKDIVIKAVFTHSDKVTITFKISGNDTPTVTIQINSGTAESVKNNNTKQIENRTSTVTITATTSDDNIQEFTVKGANNTEYDVTINGKNATWTGLVEQNLTVTATGNSSCIVEGTFITLVDGTQKPIENITPTDKVLIFNHITGKMEAGQVLFTSHGTEEAELYRIVNLQFSDGTTLRIVESHGLFDLDLNKYVYLKESNYKDYIGHRFYKSDFNGTEFIGGEITLVNAFVTEEVVRVFCPVTVFHMNCFAESLLTMPNIPYNEEGLVNFFEFGEALKYDEEKMQADIEKYGLFTYEDFSEYFSYEAFIASPAVYLKIAIGKGLITFDEILLIIEYLLQGNYIS